MDSQDDGMSNGFLSVTICVICGSKFFAGPVQGG